MASDDPAPAPQQDPPLKPPLSHSKPSCTPNLLYYKNLPTRAEIDLPDNEEAVFDRFDNWYIMGDIMPKGPPQTYSQRMKHDVFTVLDSPDCEKLTTLILRLARYPKYLALLLEVTLYINLISFANTGDAISNLLSVDEIYEVIRFVRNPFARKWIREVLLRFEAPIPYDSDEEWHSS